MARLGRLLMSSATLVTGGVALFAAALFGAPSDMELAALASLILIAALVSFLAGPRRSVSAYVSPALNELERRIENAERQRHEMRMRAVTAGRFREEFVAAVRHELKTPLNAILGFTEVLLNEIDGPLTEQQREDVTAIRQSGEHLSELVESVLAEWAPEETETPSPLHPVDLAPLVREVARLLQGQARGQRVRVEIAPELPRPLGDALRLRQILINLGTNALRATPRGTVTLSAAPDRDGVRLTVRDTGRGIDAAELPKLFDDFHQAGSASERAGGSGLGLGLTRDLVEWHGGQIEVETTLGEGSAFHVILPLEPE